MVLEPDTAAFVMLAGRATMKSFPVLSSAPIWTSATHMLS